ncbi:MAG TPA: c-type cytochrome domain-containing protein [Saprospiraceae bacterium]|nr:c-type cytochrome domain-containing protein [Saprospiraceae bacterium]
MIGQIIKNKSKIFLAGLILSGLTVLFVPSCVHESLIDPTPIDTTGNPIDTIENPADTTPTGTPCDPNVVYFGKDILPLLRSNCAKSGCHDAITHEEGIMLDSYEHVMGSDVIKPFDLHDSDLHEAITEDDNDKIMPPPPNQKLSGAQILLISKWILQGAKDLTCDEGVGLCVTTNVSYSGFVAPLLTTYCVGCHSGGAPSGGITLNTYNGVKAVAQSGKLHGAISWSTGFQKMPQGGAKLAQCNIDKIKGWIDEGALNN